MRRWPACVLLLVLVAVGASVTMLGQTPQPSDQKAPAFEVATVKANRSGQGGIGGPADRYQNGQLLLTNRPLRELMREAFQRPGTDEIIGGPSWIDSDRWDIAAKAESATDAVMPRLRTLLAERFKLVTHHETRELPIYALVIARSDGRLGPSLRPSADSTRVRINSGFFTGVAPLAMLTDGVLSSVVQRPVVDRTGLTGKFDIELHWSNDIAVGPDGAAPPPDAPSMFTALQEQLGLKLESTRGPVDVLVIDHVERPTPD